MIWCINMIWYIIHDMIHYDTFIRASEGINNQLSNRQNGVPVNDEYAEDRESNRLTTQTIQKYTDLRKYKFQMKCFFFYSLGRHFRNKRLFDISTEYTFKAAILAAFVWFTIYGFRLVKPTQVCDSTEYITINKWTHEWRTNEQAKQQSKGRTKESTNERINEKESN